MLHPTKIDIPEDKRIDLIALLQGALTEAIDLKLQSKQAHWNVRGPNFIALHELFDQVAGIVEGFADEIAERITTLGGVANGIVGRCRHRRLIDRSLSWNRPATLVRGSP